MKNRNVWPRIRSSVSTAAHRDYYGGGSLMLLEFLFAASLVFLPFESEASHYYQNADKADEYLNGSVKIIEMKNGVSFRLRSDDLHLLEFDLHADDLSYDRFTIGKEAPGSADFSASFVHGDDTVCHMKIYEDNTILRVITKGGIVRKISRLSNEMTTA